MQISIIGLDIAKNMFQAHGLDEKGEAVLRRRIRRGGLLRFFSRLDPGHGAWLLFGRHRLPAYAVVSLT